MFRYFFKFDLIISLLKKALLHFISRMGQVAAVF